MQKPKKLKIALQVALGMLKPKSKHSRTMKKELKQYKKAIKKEFDMKLGGVKFHSTNVPVKHSPPMGMRHNDSRTGFESVAKMEKGGTSKNFAALAPPYNKATYADKIAGATGKKPQMKSGGKWIQKATKSIKRRGTEGVCTGSKFGGPTCPPGSKRYNLAKTFKKMAKNK